MLPQQQRPTSWDRCYHSNVTRTPVAAILLGIQILVRESDGPLFPPEYVRKLMIVTRDSGPADFFENMSTSDSNTIDSLIKNNKDRISETQLIEGSLSSRFVFGNADFRVRKFDDYLLAQNMALRGHGDVLSACYFFNKVK